MPPGYRADRGGLAQLARASALHAEGQRFESVILHTKEYIDIKGKNKRSVGLTPYAGNERKQTRESSPWEWGTERVKK